MEMPRVRVGQHGGREFRTARWLCRWEMDGVAFSDTAGGRAGCELRVTLFGNREEVQRGFLCRSGYDEVLSQK